ncbi:MAG: PilZ domain-containing protein [Desulfobacterales bacterium]|nr:PilZ domain-containing protein [Desulfobacterales bacterium]
MSSSERRESKRIPIDVFNEKNIHSTNVIIKFKNPINDEEIDVNCMVADLSVGGFKLITNRFRKLTELIQNCKEIFITKFEGLSDNEMNVNVKVEIRWTNPTIYYRYNVFGVKFLDLPENLKKYLSNL